MTGYQLVISEKPGAARRIASALGKPLRKHIDGVEFYDIEEAFDGEHYVVGSASGHLYGLADPEKNRGIFPVFDVDWFSLSSIQSSQRNGTWKKNFVPKRSFANYALISKKIGAIASLAKGASAFIHACDYDLEGETIGSNIIRYACDAQKRVLRARFSTLTHDEIRSAFSSLRPIDSCLSRAGRMRHTIDFVWGVNVSRALTESIETSVGEYKMLTMGRVQGPTLAFVVDREIELMSHVPVPYWTITCKLRKTDKKQGGEFTASYERPRIDKKKEAEKAFEFVSKAKQATVSSIEKTTQPRPPPYPFNLGDLQREAFRMYHFSPTLTLKTAETLYLRAIISYPRTDSQRLPASIGYQRILDGLSKSQDFSTIVENLRRQISDGGSLRPRQGPAEDPAHPAIYPTGNNPAKLSRNESLLYDLVVRRFLAAFATSDLLETVSATFNISGFGFWARGTRILEEGWMKVYHFYKADGDSTLPELHQQEVLDVLGSELHSKYDDKSPRYTESSLLSKMEGERIGTKATRAETISTLLSREYISKKSSLKPTTIGLSLIDIMHRYCPDVIAPKMTELVEKKIEKIAAGEESELAIISEMMRSIKDILGRIKQNQLEIRQLFNDTPYERRVSSPSLSANSKHQNETIGKCPVCNKGELRVIRSWKTGKRFIGCSEYVNGCRASGPLPRLGIIRGAGQTCPDCGYPQVLVTLPGRWRKRTPWRLCPNPVCSSKKDQRLDARQRAGPTLEG